MTVFSQVDVYAPINGWTIPLHDVPDAAFASGAVGQGLAIEPSDSTVFAPLEATVTYIHPSHHALTLTSHTGVEVLIHIGIDTVHLGGQGFTPLVHQGQKVQAGQPLIRFELAELTPKVKSLMTLVLVTTPGEVVATQNPYSLVTNDNILLHFNASEPQKQQQSQEPLVTTKPFTITYPNGLHARPAARLASYLKDLPYTIILRHEGSQANAKSPTDILKLGVPQNGVLTVSYSQNAPEGFAQEITEYIQNQLEGPAQTQEAHESVTLTRVSPCPTKKSKDSLTWHGLGVSPGAVIGTIYHADLPPIEYPIRTLQDLEQEQKELENAITQLTSLLTQRQQELPQEEAQIFQAHITILQDPEILQQLESKIQAHHSAEQAVFLTFSEQAKQLAQLDNPILSNRAQDLYDLQRQLLATWYPKLLGTSQEGSTGNTVLLARDFTPSQVSQLNLDNIKGLIAVEGTATSHATILAQSLGLPMLIQTPKDILKLENGCDVFLDTNNNVLIEINTSNRKSITKEYKRYNQLLTFARNNDSLPVKTTDGQTITVAMNASGSENLDQLSSRPQGVGLLRSEFLFLDKHNPPSTQEQTEIYQRYLKAFPNDSVVIRTLDAGGDKPLPYLKLPSMDNPFLDERGVRLAQAYPQLFQDQVTAIFQASQSGRAAILLPMVTTLEELRSLKMTIEEVRLKNNFQAIPIGIMIEVPSTVFLAEHFAKEVDFLSIGTNDLSQYIHAVDRGASHLSHLAQPLSPALLRAIAITVHGAQKHKKAVSVCGNLAANRLALPILLGLGVAKLSVPVADAPLIKQYIRSLNYHQCLQLGLDCLEVGTTDEVETLALNFWKGQSTDHE